IDVMSRNEIVTLNGTVGSAYEKQLAKAAAWVAGVDSVDASNLDIKPGAREEMMREQKFYTPSDEQIKQAVSQVFEMDPRIDKAEIDIAVNEATVNLSGEVDNLMAKRAAEEDAENTVGVTGVTNRIKVRPEEIVPNEKLEERVERALVRDPYVELFDINVRARNGKVILEGTVHTSFEKTHAENVASEIIGVVQVANMIDYKQKWLWQQDDDIKGAVKRQIFWDPYVDPDNIRVEVENGIVTLSGTVNNFREKVEAEENAFDAGAKDVMNKLRIKG
ncbi:MAG: BON domain-containing protein, partial [candidate division Zixibacteria bacterium]|nr:BON domain-containing protein [candidate division Zixibacteria bacterium]